MLDRGLIDAVAAHEHDTGDTVFRGHLARSRYGPTVFFTPPWSEIFATIFATSAERWHGFHEASREYELLRSVYANLGYDLRELASAPVPNRADALLSTLGLS
ncbi:AAA family ATPase [Salipiger mucosus]|uniref:AAA family ATPase n=1 Tax=Salipiger mucosus TaxID=263378 RepID=UPI0018DCC42C|nr:AAA family ATPase [Salipiger mucosus]